MKTKRFTKKNTAITLLALVLLAGGVLFALEKLQITNFISSSTDTSGPSTEQVEQQKQADNDTKKSFIEEDTSTAPTPVVPMSSDDIVITAKQEANGDVTVLTQLTGFPDGECNLVVQNGAKSTTKTAQIIYQPEFSTCAGFTVAKSELGAGAWTFTLTAKTSSSDPLTKTQSLQVN